MKTETFEFAGYSGTNLPAYLWLPDGDVKALLQVTHGMTEHMGRYEAFAEYLIPQGNVTIKLYSGARHDLLHEEKNGAEAARKFIAEWIKL